MFVAACASPPENLEKMSQTLPVPSDAVPLTFLVEESQGSQDACFFTRRVTLYASRSSVKEVIEFYSSNLPPSGWEVQDREKLLFRHGGSYALSLNYAASSNRSSISEKFRDVDMNSDIMRTHQTLYEVTITYADPIAQVGCPIWNR